MILRNDGVPDVAVGLEIGHRLHLLFGLPVPPGNTVQPSACAPVSNIEPAGVKWYEKQLCTRSPVRKPAAKSARAIRQ